MKVIQLLLVTLILCTLPQDALAAFDSKQCQRIDDVAVPYDVAMDNASVTFSSRSDRIVVRMAGITAGGKTFGGHQVGRYYADVRRFLANSRTMANAALPFSGERATMGAAATQMCIAIIDVAASGAAIEQAFPGFLSPVRIKFK